MWKILRHSICNHVGVNRMALKAKFIGICYYVGTKGAMHLDKFLPSLVEFGPHFAPNHDDIRP